MNIITKSDSYKFGSHWNMYPKGTEYIYSYLESRQGAKFPLTPFFGLQANLLKNLCGEVVLPKNIDAAERLAQAHFGTKDAFNRKGWEYICEKHRGTLPLRIKAVPEGTPVPTGNVMMTVQNTDPEVPWLTNYVESILSHVWYPSTVCALSRRTKEIILWYLQRSADSLAGLPFMLHDFGYRGVSSDESAMMGGMGASGQLRGDRHGGGDGGGDGLLQCAPGRAGLQRAGYRALHYDRPGAGR